MIAYLRWFFRLDAASGLFYFLLSVLVVGLVVRQF